MKNFRIRVSVKFVCLFLCFVEVVVGSFLPIHAASLTGLAVGLGNPYESQTTSYKIDFTTATSAVLTEIDFAFRTTSGGSVTPTGLSVSSATLGSLTGLNASWVIDKSSASQGYLKVKNATGQLIAGSSSLEVNYNSIVNPSAGACLGANHYYDTCYITITTVDLNSANTDSGNASFVVEANPSITFGVAGVNSGIATNGVTTTAASTYNTIPFGHVISGDRAYVAHQLTVTTNAPNGYNVYMTVSSQMQGVYQGSFVSPFSGLSASWASPQAWSDPNGTISGTNTSWLGANTSDTRVTGWSSASAKFAPADGNKNIVMHSSTYDSGTSIYVTYAFETNIYQIPDLYSGTIQYIVVPTY